AVMTLILLAGVAKGVDIAHEFAKGAKESLLVVFEILPTLILIMTAVGMFSASGAVEAIALAVSPVTQFLGFPGECVGLALIRPFSGSGALCTLESILEKVSPDSFAGRAACVMMGSTETTFYTVSIYFAALKRRAYPMVFAGACFADACGVVLSALAVRIFF
ncbi:MAG: spore maturation protein, partial [Ruminococcus sp.]|nr:spore maturation protein [Ruminococcus sp.]